MSSPSASGAAARHQEEVARGERFEFGKNWTAFLRVLNEERIQAARDSFTQMLGRSDLGGQTFLDIGSGSGLSSLVAYRLGARRVVSFDYDPESVRCTAEVKRRFAPSAAWRVEQGSVLDEEYLTGLGHFDIVYSWGVLHHTGDMWRALELVTRCVKPGGLLFLAIYNDQGAWSRRWTKIKKFYCSGALARLLVAGTVIPYWILRGFAADLVWMRNPLKRYRDYQTKRGMSVLRDWFDWLGGFPFEVAKPEAIFEFYRARGFNLRTLHTTGGDIGCNQFVFERSQASEPQAAAQSA